MEQHTSETEDRLYAKLSPEDRDEALYTLKQYCEVVLGIFLRREREAAERMKKFYTILTSCPSLPTLKGKGRVILEKST